MLGPIQVAMMTAKHQKQLHTGQCLRNGAGIIGRLEFGQFGWWATLW